MVYTTIVASAPGQHARRGIAAQDDVLGASSAGGMVDRVEAIFSGHVSLSRTASAAATELIREAIMDGRLAPGQRLKEVELARELGISRTPIREALLLLQAEGLVDASPNRGSTVRAYGLRELEEIYELRALLEGQAARRAATRAEPDTLIAMRASCDRFEAIVDDVGRADRIESLVRENGVFHDMILAAADSARLTGMVRQLILTPLVYKSYIWYSPEQARLSFHAHDRLVRTLERGDAERAEAIMREHVYQALDVLVGHLTTEAPV